MTPEQLKVMQSEIAHELRTNQVFARDYQYWNTLLTRTKLQVARREVETIY